MDQIPSSHFELTHICSVQTLVTKSISIMYNTNYIVNACGNMKIYLWDLCDLGCDNGTELNCTIASLFLYQSLVWGNNITSFALNFVYYSRDNNIDWANRTPCVETLLTHDIIDKAAYLSQATT